MDNKKSSFKRVLSKENSVSLPLYCTGYPEWEFLEKYITSYMITPNLNPKLILKGKDYSIIKQMGFDAISIWEFRRGVGGYSLNDNYRVDGWGRIYKGEWYQWDGVIKNRQILEKWEHLTLPSKQDFSKLQLFIDNISQIIDPVLSVPGLFEKSWQWMGYVHFAKSLRNDLNFLEEIILYFTNYIKSLIRSLQEAGATLFIIADDCAYKKRTFLSKELWRSLFFQAYHEIIEIIHKKSHQIILHSDGDISNMMQIFIDLGFDGIQSLEPNAGVDIFSLFKMYRDEICFIGNLDVSTLLTYGTPSQVQMYVEKLLKKAKKFNSSLIISPTQQINVRVKPENIKSMIESTSNFKYVIEE